MKKIININLAGRVIPIEDSAYEHLQEYIESLRRYFAKEEGRDEIINDIENRIAELMNEKVRKGATCIADADINEIIGSMGRPEDFEAEEDEHPAQSTAAGSGANSTFAGKKRGRLYRDAGDKIIGGVCAGVADYLNVDPAIIRLIFAIIIFGSWGFGLLLYFILWIILPVKELDGYRGKRLFRNPEDKIIGGVASGLAAYFKKEAWVIRLIFAAPLLLYILVGALSWPFLHFGAIIPGGVMFGSLTGTFILAYIIMWIVLPEAKTQYDKMEMRGEKVDVNTIRQTVKDEMKQFKDRAGEFGKEVKESAQRFGAKAKEFADTRGKTFATEFAQTARPIAGGIGHAIGVLFKAFFLFIAGTIAFTLFVVLMTLIFSGIGFWPLKKAAFEFIFDGFWQNAYAWATVVLFFIVPLVAFITWLVRRMMNIKSQSNYLGWIFGGLWVLGMISFALFIGSMFANFRNYEKVDQNLDITQPVNNRMFISIPEPEIRFSSGLWWFDGGTGWDLTGDSLKMANVKMRINKSADSNYYVKIWRYSAGKNRKDAMARAEKIQFNAHYLDSVLNLGSGLAIDKGSKFRGQGVVVEVLIPEGKKIIFDESISEKLRPFTIRVNQRRGWSRNQWEIDFENYDYFEWDTNVEYIMNSDGSLTRTDRPASLKNSNQSDYRYKKNVDEIRKDIEELKRKLEEEKRKLEEAEQKLNEIQQPTVNRRESIDDVKEDFGVPIISPVFSLVKYFN